MPEFMNRNQYASMNTNVIRDVIVKHFPLLPLPGNAERLPSSKAAYIAGG
jgi:hypothetical protein